MSPKRIVSLTLVLLVALLAAPGALAQAAAAPPPSPRSPHVVILATGGTIAGVQPKEGEPGYKSGSLSIDSLIKGAPGHREARPPRRRADRVASAART